MAWSDIAIPMLRVIINDSSSPYTYSDDRLTSILMAAGVLINQDIKFDGTYTVDYVNETITPDPSTDLDFLTFLIIRAACLTDFSTFRTKAVLDGLSAKMGPASLTVSDNLKGFKDLLVLGPCKTYEDMKNDYVFGSGGLCQAVLSPFIGNNFNPENLQMNINYYFHR